MHSIFLRKITVLLALICSAVIFSGLISCASVPDSGMGKRETSSSPVYYGEGNEDSALAAMAAARRHAVQQAALDLLGSAADSEKVNEVESLFESLDDVSPYLFKDTQETIESSSDGSYFYILGIRVNLEAIAGKLIENDILGGQVGGKNAVYILKDQVEPAIFSDPGETDTGARVEDVPDNNGSVESTAVRIAVPEVSAAELEIIGRYLDGLTYMVYFNEEAAADPYLSRTAVVGANSFLAEEDYDYIDLVQIETIKREQSAVYEEETGLAVSIIQWIAHKVNADIYIEVSLDAFGETKDGLHYGSADVSLNCFEATTAEERGHASSLGNPPVISMLSIDDALSKAVSSAVYEGMKAAVKEARAQTAKFASMGFEYTLTMMKTPDDEIIDDFMEKLGRRVKSVKRISVSPEESTFEVYLIGNIADLEDLAYEIAKSVPGLKGLMLVMQRRNSIIFDTGM